MHREPSPFLRSCRALLSAVVLVVLAAGGCADDQARSSASPPPTDLLDAVTAPPRRDAPTSSAPLPDTRDVALTPVTGPAPADGPVLEIYGGEATLSGSLGYEGEPVVDATVHLERWVDGVMTSVELTTGPGGGWQASGIHGGRYVIRAWKGTRLVLPQASAVFIAEDEERAVHLAMAEVVVPDDDDDDEDEDEDDEDEDDEDKDDEGDDGSDHDDEDSDTTATTEDDG